MLTLAFIRPYQGSEILVVQLAAYQPITGATNGLLPITRAGSWILFSLKEMKVCIVPFLFGPLSLRIA